MSQEELTHDYKGFLESLLNRQLQLTVSDGRMFAGTFVCTDKDGSAILNDTQEYRGADKRFVGLVVLPGRHVRKVELVHTEDAFT